MFKKKNVFIDIANTSILFWPCFYFILIIKVPLTHSLTLEKKIIMIHERERKRREGACAGGQQVQEKHLIRPLSLHAAHVLNPPFSAYTLRAPEHSPHSTNL